MVTVDAQFQALADPTRRAILHLVWSRQRSAGEIASQFELSRPAISRHLRVLRESRLVRVRAVGTTRFYQADTEEFDKLRAHFETFWTNGLRKLKQVAEADNQAKRKNA